MVRPYKGVDVLITALSAVNGVELLIAGEFWQPEAEFITAIDRAGLNERVRLRSGYVPIDEIATLFGGSDVLALPYRGGSASFNVALAHRFGLPVVATDVGTFARDIRNGIDGYVVPPEDPDALARALTSLSDPEIYQEMRSMVPFVDGAEEWSRYIDVVEGFLPDITH
jgi:glycosyltransferase involved in cell wall biosynthesis